MNKKTFFLKKLTALGVRWTAPISTVIPGSTTLLVLLQVPKLLKALLWLAVLVLVDARGIVPLIIASTFDALVLLRVPLLSSVERLTLCMAHVQLL